MNTKSRVLNRTRVILVATLATVGVAAVAVGAATSTDTTPSVPSGHSWHGHHHGPGGRFMHVLKQLNLTAEQKTQVHGIFAAAKTQFQALGSSIRSNHEAMDGLAPTDSNYPALLATAKANAGKRLELMSSVKTQIYSVLTPAQQQQIPQILAADKAKWQQRHQSAPASPTATPATSS